LIDDDEDIKKKQRVKSIPKNVIMHVTDSQALTSYLIRSIPASFGSQLVLNQVELGFRSLQVQPRTSCALLNLIDRLLKMVARQFTCRQQWEECHSKCYDHVEKLNEIIHGLLSS
jgi:hypothetical protein